MEITKNFKKLYNFSDLGLLSLSLFIFFLSVFYYIFNFHWIFITFSVFLSIISLIILSNYNLIPQKTPEKDEISINKLNKSQILLIFAYFLFLSATFLELFFSTSTKSLISPWEVTSWRFFFFYILGLILLVKIIYANVLKNIATNLLISSFIFLSLAVALIIYRLGYGFDPFIHQAAMEMIAKNSVIYPKTPYYLGQYNLIVSLNYLTGLSISFLNKITVPLVAALFLPLALSKLSKKIITDNNKTKQVITSITTIIAIALVFNLFIATTPQNLSYIFLILTIFSGLIEKKPIKTLIFSLATAAIHPISGIPALIWSSWLIFKTYQHKLAIKWQKIISASILYLSAIIMPLALFITSGAKIKNIKLSVAVILEPIKNIFTYKYAGAQDWLLNLVYLIYNQYTLLIIALIGLGIYLFWKNKTDLKSELTQNYTWRGLLSVNISLGLAFILSTQINFPELINYEQSDFANRILIIILLFLSPFAIITISYLVEKIVKSQIKIIKIWWLAIFIFFITSSLYLAYPRFDKYFNSRGYSTGKLDIEAVQKISELSTQEYIVLANQQVSAAALKTHGFNNYYDSKFGPIYFYPIPTGGILYQYYLDMVYKNPDRKTMLEAMSLVGAQEGYLVINDYWHESGKIIKAAKLSADNYFEIGDKNIFIFQYLKP